MNELPCISFKMVYIPEREENVLEDLIEVRECK